MMAEIKRESSTPAGETRDRQALVVGTGPAGLMVSRALIDLGIAVSICDVAGSSSSPYCAAPGFDIEAYLESLEKDPTGVEMLEPSGIPKVHRDGTGFVADLGNGRRERFGCVVLTPGVSMIPLSGDLPAGIESISPGSMMGPGRECLFLLDYGPRRTDPAVGMTAIKQAIENHEAGGRSIVLMRHAQVAHLFGESLYEHAKRSGVRFVRFGDQLPVIEAEPGEDGRDGRFRVTMSEPVAGVEELVIWADRVLAAGRPDGSSVPQAAGDIASGDVDEEGFLLSSSVHCHSGRSFTNGVFAVGEAVGGMDFIRIAAQAASAAVRARAWMIRAEEMKDSEAVSFTDDCIRCLTCTRICPHAALAYNLAPARSTIEASAAACGECGVCVAECPRLVLDLVSFPDPDMASFLEGVRAGGTKPVVVYGCRRSAGRAAAGLKLPKDALFRSVPCAGRVSEALLWATFEAGASGILVAGCHHGNCASDTGTDWARARTESVVEKLAFPSGIPLPLGYVTVAANEGARFGRIVAEFGESIATENKWNTRASG